MISIKNMYLSTIVSYSGVARNIFLWVFGGLNFVPKKNVLLWQKLLLKINIKTKKFLGGVIT